MRDPASMDAFGATLTELYRSYVEKKPLIAGRFDRELRDPRVLVSVAERLGLCPPPEHVVKVTGSKGKGTTSRLIAHYIRQLAPADEPVGLFVSPEEYEHTDRMKIDGAPISQDEMVALFETLRPHLAEEERRLTGASYISPFGVFTLIALSWFRAHKAKWLVLETGRGALHDEVGILPSRVGVITSILAEHLNYLGPALCDVAREKLGLAESSWVTLLSAQAHWQAGRCGLDAGRGAIQEDESLPLREGLPNWYAVDDRLARQAAGLLLEVSDERLRAIDIGSASASWGRVDYRGRELIYEGLIHLDSLDKSWFDREIRGRRALLLCSLPDDKDRERIVSFFERIEGAAYREIVLTGDRGFLLYNGTEARGSKVAARIDFEDRAGFLGALEAQIAVLDPEVVYCCGTQTYIRLVKLALSGLGLAAGPASPLRGVREDVG